MAALSSNAGVTAPERTSLPYRSKTDLVTDYLREELQAGRPAAGKRLVVSQVAARLGISKVPVREAVTRLIGEGLLVHYPNIGPVVPEFTAHEVIETALMRVAIENVALDSAVPRHTPDTVRELGVLLERMKAADADFPQLNVEFHLSIVRVSPYGDMVRTAQSLLERAQRYSAVHRIPGYRDCAHSEHVELFRVLETGDVETLKYLNERHVMKAAEKLAEQMAKS